MRFGTFFLLEKPANLTDVQVFRNALEQVQATEDMGYDSVWLAEHRFTEYGIMPDTMVFAAHVAATTRRIKIGTAVVVLPFHNPIRLAEQVAMVDVMSNGRYLFGVGRGYQAGEYRGFNIPMDQSKDRFHEVLDICRGLWTTDRFSYQGKFHQVEDLSILPKPIQRPHPPVYLTVMRTPESFKFAADHGFGVVSGNPYRMDPEFREAFLLYRKELEERGQIHMLEEFWSLAQTFVHHDERVAYETPRASTDSYMQAFKKYGTPRQADGSLAADYSHYGKDWDAFLETDYDRQAGGTNFLIGNPQAVVDKVGLLREEGMKNFILWFNRGGAIPQRAVLDSMELFAAKVMPHFAERPLAASASAAARV